MFRNLFVCLFKVETDSFEEFLDEMMRSPSIQQMEFREFWLGFVSHLETMYELSLIHLCILWFFYWKSL